MPDLPTITVTQTQADRMLAAYAPGGTQAEAVANYRKWLREAITLYVLKAELAALRAQNREEEAQLTQSVEDALAPPPTP